MRVTVNPDSCRGHARCLAIAPEVFDYDDVNDVAVVIDDAVPSAPSALIEKAVEACPEQAISAEAD
jgi:ferredoxin